MDGELEHISHEEMCRRMLHFAVRTHFCLEDSLANHLLCQSMQRVISDLYENKFSKDMIDTFLESHEMPKWFDKKTFISQFRQNYNKLKHADRDQTDPKKLDYFNFNSIIIIICINGYFELFNRITMHSTFFLVYFSVFVHPDFKIDSFDDGINKFSSVVKILREVRADEGDKYAWDCLSKQFFQQTEIITEIETDRV